MKNIYILPTGIKSKIGYLTKKGKELNDLVLIDKSIPTILETEYQHIYITSSEEIEKDDYYYNERLNQVFQAIRYSGYNTIDKEFKVVLTDDPTLIADGVQEIEEDFLKWFVKNPTCEFIEVRKIFSYFSIDPFVGYKITIPQELCGRQDENYNCETCGEPCGLDGHYIEISENLEKETLEKYLKKHGLHPRYPYYKEDTISQEEPKQELLEEITMKLYREDIEYFNSDRTIKYDFNKDQRIAFKVGAKFQAQRMYSEEEVFDLLKKSHFVEQNIEEWFNQNKKNLNLR